MQDSYSFQGPVFLIFTSEKSGLEIRQCIAVPAEDRAVPRAGGGRSEVFGAAEARGGLEWKWGLDFRR